MWEWTSVYQYHRRLLAFCVVVCFLAFLLVVSGFAQTVPQDYFGALKWRLIGPFRSGRTIAGAGVPGDPNTFYFGSVNGGVWKTTNAGVTWSPIFDTEPVASIGAIAISPSNPKIIYVGTGETDIRSDLGSGNGVYKSTDGGQTWKNIGLHDTRQIARIVVNPANPDVVYVGALGYAYGPNDERGVYKSTDGGATWSRVLFKDANTGVADLAMAFANPDILFATLWNTHRPPWSTYAPIDGPGSGLYRSLDAGATWTELKGHGLPDGNWGRAGVTVSPDGKRVYALIDAGNKSGLYRSDDGGNTWTLANADKRLTSRAWYFNWPTIDPNNPDVVYIPNVALYRTEDGGKSISIVRGAPGGDDYHALWVDPKNSDRMILLTDQGATISVDYGKTWSSWYNQPVAQMYHVTTDNQFPYAVYGTQQDSGSIAVASRTDHGIISAQNWVNIDGSESGYIVVDPNDPNILYITGTLGSVARMDRRTSLSQDITPWQMPNWGSEINQRRYRGPWTPMLVMSPKDHALYLGTQYVMKTTDGGLHWEKISPDLTGGRAEQSKASQAPTVANATELGFGVVYAIAPSPLNAEQIWVGTDTGFIQLTTDGGKTWKNVTPQGVTDWSRVSMVEASHFDPGEAFAAVDRHRLNDQHPYIYRTRDFGKSWQLINTGIGDHSFVRAVREDPVRKGLLFAGTELGPYVSFDDGDHWQQLQLNLPVTPIYDLDIHDTDLIVATHGRSFWVLDDITPLRQAASQSSTAKAWLYEPARAVRVDNDAFLGTPYPPEEPQAKNPPDGAIIDYFLRDPAQLITLEIFDNANQLVRRYSSAKPPSGKHPPLPIAERWFPKPEVLENTVGMHRFVWDLRWATSGEKTDGDEDNATAPKGPRVVPGTYTVKLTVDGQPLTQKLTVIMDPRSSATAAVLAEQLRIGREIYADTLISRKVLSEAGSVRRQLEGEKATPSVSKQVNNFLTAMNHILNGEGPAMGLTDANVGLLAALRVVEGGNRTIPEQTMELYRDSKNALEQRNAEWQKLKTTELPQLNQVLQRAGVKPVEMSAIEEEIQYLMTR